MRIPAFLSTLPESSVFFFFRLEDILYPSFAFWRTVEDNARPLKKQYFREFQNDVHAFVMLALQSAACTFRTGVVLLRCNLRCATQETQIKDDHILL